MPGWPRFFVTDNLVTTPLVNATETVVAALTGIDGGAPGAQISLLGICRILTGATTNRIDMRMRRVGAERGAAGSYYSIKGTV